MEKADILLIGFILCTISYLVWEMHSPPQAVTTALIETMPENTLVSLQGLPANVRKYGDGLAFFLNGIEIRTTSIKLLEKSNISVQGYVYHYNGRTYVETLQIVYAS